MKKHKRAQTKRPVVRILIIWAVQVVAFGMMSWLLNGVEIDNLGTAILAVVIIALLNVLLWPILSYILVPFAVLTLGLVALLLNGLMVWLAAELLPGLVWMASGPLFGWRWA